MKERTALALVGIGIAVLLPPVLVVIAARYVWAMVFAPHRAWAIALAFDRLGSATTNGDGKYTISSRAAFARDEGKRWACVLCKLLDRIDPNHCDKSRGI